MNSLFATNPINLDITRSKFKRPSNLKTTFEMGKLIPIYVDEVLPGDTKKMYNRKLLRMQTPIKPLMDSLQAQVYWFFVPNRIIYDNWEELQGANKSGPWTQQTQYSVPQTTSPSSTGWASGSLADYMGLPIGVANLSVSSLPFRAYVQIWNDWFRDENLQDFSYIDKSSTNTTGTNNTSNYITDPITGGMCLPVSKLHDYYTSALPEPQKGPDVLLPLGSTAPVKGNNLNIGLYQNNDSNLGVPYGAISSSGQGVSGSTTAYGKTMKDATNPTYTPNLFTDGRGVALTPDGSKSGLIADLSNATAATINNLRQAFAVQRMYERDARGGTRYIEILKSHFGVTSSDARLQRPEYLNGKTIPVNIQQVNQTSSTDSTSPQGNTAAYSLTGDEEFAFTKSFEEHGILMGLICVRQDHSYSQGIEKFWSRKTRTDFYMPVFANLSEQPILNKEIYAQGTSTDSQVFGYQEAWADYRYKPSKLTGLMRPNATGNIAIWNLGDNFASLPTLGPDFIAETKDNLNRCLTVSSATSGYQFILDCYFEPIETRPMPVRSIPGLIDHH